MKNLPLKLWGKKHLRFTLYYLTLVVGLRAARTWLKRLRSKSYDVNTQLTHVLDTLEPKVLNKHLNKLLKQYSLRFLKKREKNKMSSEIFNKNIAKKCQNCPQSLADSEASTTNPIKYLRQFSDSQLFIAFFSFCHKTPEGPPKKY